MSVILAQTGTASGLSPAAFCSGATVNPDAVSRKLEIGGTGAGSGTGFELAASATRAVVALITDADHLDGYTWGAGNWTVRLNVVNGNMNVRLDEIHICRLNSSGTSQGTIGSLTGIAETWSTTGTKTHTVSGSAQTPATGDRIAIVVVVTNLNTMGASSFGLQFNQNVDTPFTAPAIPEREATVSATLPLPTASAEATAEPPKPPISELVDDFSGDLGAWNVFTFGDASAAIVDEELVITIPSGKNNPGAELQHKERHDFTGGAFAFEIVAAPSGDASDLYWALVEAGAANTADTAFGKATVELYEGEFYPALRRPGIGTLNDGPYSFDPVDDRWVRWFDDGGDLKFQTSPDGQDWTTIHTYTAAQRNWSLLDVGALIGAAQFVDPSSGTTAVIDNVNAVPEVGSTAVLSASVPLPSASASVVSAPPVEREAIVSATVPLPSAAAEVTAAAPTTSAALAATVPLPTAEAAATIAPPVERGAEITATVPLPSASVDIATAPAGSLLAEIAATVPLPTASATAVQIGPLGATVSATVPLPTASLEAVQIEPLEAIVTATMPLPSAEAAVTAEPPPPAFATIGALIPLPAASAVARALLPAPVLIDTLAGDAEEFLDEGAVSGRRYRYYIVAENAFGTRQSNDAKVTIP